MRLSQTLTVGLGSWEQEISSPRQLKSRGVEVPIWYIFWHHKPLDLSGGVRRGPARDMVTGILSKDFGCLCLRAGQSRNVTHLPSVCNTLQWLSSGCGIESPLLGLPGSWQSGSAHVSVLPLTISGASLPLLLAVPASHALSLQGYCQMPPSPSLPFPYMIILPHTPFL